MIKQYQKLDGRRFVVIYQVYLFPHRETCEFFFQEVFEDKSGKICEMHANATKTVILWSNTMRTIYNKTGLQDRLTFEEY